MSRNGALTVIDLFAGVGGLAEGFHKAGPETCPAFTLRLLVDTDFESAYTFKRNRPGVPYWVADIARISPEKILEHAKLDEVDVVIGGPPCQGFSPAGRRLFDDPRNALLRDFIRIAAKLAPKAILLENVPSLFGETHGKYGEELLDNLKETGYEAVAKVLQASDFGVPQIRRRAFVLALRRGMGVTPSLPKGSGPSVTVEQAIGDLPPLEAGKGQDPTFYATPPQNEYQRERRGESTLLFNHVAPNHSADLVQRLSVVPEGGANGQLAPERRSSDRYYSQAYARLHRDRFAYTVTGSFLNPGSGRFVHYRDVRAITAREAARLQSFDDDFVFHGYLSAQERHVGNAVPPLLARVLAEHLAELLRSADC